MSGIVLTSSSNKRPGRFRGILLVFLVLVLTMVVGILVTQLTPATAGEADAAADQTSAMAEASAATSPATVEAAEAVVSSAEPATETLSVAEELGVEYSAAEIEFIQLANEYRESNGLEPLLVSDLITVACDRHCSDMATYGFMDHLTGYRDTASGGLKPMKGKSSDYFSTGTDPAERMIASGYDFATVMGENLAAGYDDAAGALEGFKASPTHNAILLSPEFKVIGISLVYDSDSDYGYYWTTDFGGHVDYSAHEATITLASAE